MRVTSWKSKPLPGYFCFLAKLTFKLNCFQKYWGQYLCHVATVYITAGIHRIEFTSSTVIHNLTSLMNKLQQR